MTDEEKMLTAYHEGGHAIVALNVKATDPVHKATIIPRGRALGMVMQLPERDKLSMSLEQMTSRLAIIMAGRVAEELVFGREKVTSGAASDIEQGTKLARMMVTRWGRWPMARTRTRCSSAIRCRASTTSRKRPRARSTPKCGNWSRQG